MTADTSEIKETLSELASTENIPQNIRKSAEGLSELFLNSDDNIESKKNKALQILEEMAVDLNIDMATRTTLYHAISLVESLNNKHE